MNDLFGKHIWQIFPGKPRVHFGQGEVVWSSEKVGTEGGHLSNIYFQIFSFIKYLLNRICCIIKYLRGSFTKCLHEIIFDEIFYLSTCYEICIPETVFKCLIVLIISCFRWPKERKFWSTNMQTTSKTRLWKLSQTNVNCQFQWQNKAMVINTSLHSICSPEGGSKYE